MFAPEHIDRSSPATGNGWAYDAPVATGAGKARLILLGLTTSALVLVGATAPLFLTSGFTRKYAVETALRIDAASLSKTEKQRALEEAGKAVRSPASLDGMVRTLDLARDLEFAVSAPSAVGVLSDIVTGREMTVSAADAKLRDRLSAAFTANADANGDRISILVETTDANKSTRIARLVAAAYERELAVAAVRSARSHAADLERAMHNAETAVAAALPKGSDRDAALREAQERSSLDEDISMLDAALTQLRGDAATVAATTLADVLAKPLTSVFDYSGIDQMRQNHVDAKILLDQLSASLGPRHPRLIAAQASLDDARSKIDATVKRLSTSLKQQEETAATELAGLKSRREKLAATPPSADAKALADLQVKADKARQDYLKATQRLDAASVAGPLAVRTTLAATADNARTVGISTGTLSGIGALAGLLLGLMVAFVTRRREQETEQEQDELDLFENEEVDLLAPQPSIAPVARPPASERPYRVYTISRGQPAEEAQDEFVEETHAPAADSDISLADRLREMLMANRMQSEAAEAGLPSLVSAVMAAGAVTEPSYADTRRALAEQEAARVDALRRDMASLRERVSSYNQRRTTGQR